MIWSRVSGCGDDTGELGSESCAVVVGSVKNLLALGAETSIADKAKALWERWCQYCERTAAVKWFEQLVVGSIVVNALFMCLVYEGESILFTPVESEAVNVLIIGVFIWEMAVKLRRQSANC